MKLLFFGIILFSLFFASWYVLHGDIYFTTDIGRDFRILQEIDQKKIILIGPRASGDMFHGPGWPYLNYPFYLLGNGNPIIVAWGWIFFVLTAGVIAFYVAKDLFGEISAYVYSAMITLYNAFYARGMINPNAILVLMPLFFYSFVKYYQTLKPKFLLLHFAVSFLMFQSELMSIPYLVLSFSAILYRQIKIQKLKHVGFFLLIPLFIANFLIFDLRHDHILLNRALAFASPKTEKGIFDYKGQIENRIRLAFTGTEIVRRDSAHRNLILFSILLIFITLQLRNNKYKTIYFSFLYFYFGFFILSFMNKGQILYFHLFPVFPLVFLMYASLVKSRYKILISLIFAFLFISNIQSAVQDMNDSEQFIGKDIYSWKFLSTMSSEIFKGKERGFGYFVYAPDTVAHEENYAAAYANRISKANAYKSEKKTVTYLIIAPPPPNNRYMYADWWIVNKVHINKNPVSEMKFENGYKIQKYLLTEEEIKVPPDPNIDLGIFFR